MAKQAAAKKKDTKGRPKPSLLAKKPADSGRKVEPKKTIVVRLVDYLKNVRVEMRKVMWPKRSEILSSTLIVIATLVVLAGYVFTLDEIFAFFINTITGAGAALGQ
jgi:preprotein translocase subunit SecE